MRVLVTGGSGFMGRHLVRALAARGDSLVVAGRRARAALPAGSLPAEVEYTSVDLGEPGAASSLVHDARPARVFHLASAADVGGLGLLEEQVRSTQMAAVHVARACLEHGVERLVHVGSGKEYGNGPAPCRETQDPAPISPYGAAKAAATAFVRMLCSSFGLRAVVVRPFLVYGPEQESNLLIPGLIHSALAGRDFPMTAGEQLREFNYVDDLVEGLLRAGEAADVDGQIVNLGCGEPRRLRDVVSLVLELMGNPIRAEFGKLPYRPGENFEFYAATDRARALLGFEPRVPLEEGLRRTIDWYRAQGA